MKKWITKLILTVLLTPVVLLVVWYSISFLPHLNEIKKMVENGNEQVEPIFESFYPLAVAGESKKGIRNHALRQVYWSLVHSKKRQSMGSWHLNNMLWYLASHIHLTDQEVFGLWVNCAAFKCDKGLHEASQIYYKKKLSDLTVEEQAGLVALVRSPSIYKVGSEKSKIRINEIMNKVGAHNK